MSEHKPHYHYCPDPEHCCRTFEPIYINCEECGQGWPCEAKRSHITEAEAERISRWVDGRIGR